MKKEKISKIVYWIFTAWLALGMSSTGIVQLIKMEQEVTRMEHLGFPIYFLTILGVSKLLGVITVLIPNFLRLKEWAYAGFVFTMLGAIFTHFAVSDPFSEFFPAILLLTITLISYYFRPANRKLA